MNSSRSDSNAYDVANKSFLSLSIKWTQRRLVIDPILRDADSAMKIARNQLQRGAPFLTRRMKAIMAEIRIGTAVFKTKRCPWVSATLDHNGAEITVVSAASAVSEPAIVYRLSTECTKRMIAMVSIAIGIRAIKPAEAIRLAPGVVKSSVYVLNKD